MREGTFVTGYPLIEVDAEGVAKLVLNCRFCGTGITNQQSRQNQGLCSACIKEVVS